MSRQMFWVYLKNSPKGGITITHFHLICYAILLLHLLKRCSFAIITTFIGARTVNNNLQIYTHVETEHLRKIYDKNIIDHKLLCDNETLYLFLACFLCP